MTTDSEDSPEITQVRRDLLGQWGAEIRERLRLAEIALVPEESRRVNWPGPGPSGPLLHINRPSVSRTAGNQKSAKARKAWKTGVLEMPKDAPPVRHPNSLIAKLADRLQATLEKEPRKC